MANSYTKEEMKKTITEKLSGSLGVSPQDATDDQYYKALAGVCQEIMTKNAYDYFESAKNADDTKKISYLCMEFLMGRSLKNNLYNLGLTDQLHFENQDTYNSEEL